MNRIKFIYECPLCYVKLPYYNADHNCPDSPNDEGFYEIDSYLQDFVVWLGQNHAQCRTLTDNVRRVVYRCCECRVTLPYPRCPHPCTLQNNIDEGYEESPEELPRFYDWLQRARASGAVIGVQEVQPQ